MLDFVIATDTPARLRDFLISRGVLKEENGKLVGTHPGMKWVKVPNQIITDPGSGTPGGTMVMTDPGSGQVPPGTPYVPPTYEFQPNDPNYVPPTYDTRHIYKVRFSGDSEANEGAKPPMTGPGQPKPDPFDWSKFGRWVRDNSTVVAAPAGWTIGGEPVGNARKVNGQNVWLMHDRPERFGSWQ